MLISLGSNIEPEVNLPLAVQGLGARFSLVGVSRIYEAEPVGAPAAPKFLNAAVAIETDVAPAELKFGHLRPLEAELGRVRTSDPNAPRTIDLDIALAGELIVADAASGLEIPDPEILRRAHVALPLADLAPDAVHPVTGETLFEIARRFRAEAGIRVYDGLSLPPRDTSREPAPTRASAREIDPAKERS